MADNSSIEWTDDTWNPITGCSIVSPGCTNCYAMRLAGTRLQHHPSRIGLTCDSKSGPVWTGEVQFNEQWLDQPLRWKRPRRIFVCAHGDLFAEGVPDEWIDRVFAVMALAPQHTFQVLTKRAARMREYMTDRSFGCGYWEHWAKKMLRERNGDPHKPVLVGKTLAGTWPWPHVWLGVSAEDQERADERIPDLLATPAAKRFVSLEPLLGPIYLENPLAIERAGQSGHWRADGTRAALDWVIVGGESGRGARPMHPAWARSLRDQCAAAGVPFFFKQWGEHFPNFALEGLYMASGVVREAGGLQAAGMGPDQPAICLDRVGKRAAGHLLDGREHRELPA